MKIRKEQMDAMSESLKEEFIERMVAHLWIDLRKQCEAQQMKEEDVESFVRRGINDAEEHGITSEVGIRQYIDCMVILGPNFDSDGKYPWAQEILSDDDLTPSERADALAWRKLFEVEWEDPADG